MIHSISTDNPVLGKYSSHSQSEIIHGGPAHGHRGVFESGRNRQPVGGGARDGPLADHGHEASRSTGSAPWCKALSSTTRRLSITDAGRSYLESCERILAEIEAADAAVSADRIEPRGLLRLNVPLVFGVRQIAPRLGEFARRHPRVTVELGLNDRLVDLAEEGWDLAIRIGSLRDSSLMARRLAPCRMTICAAPS